VYFKLRIARPEGLYTGDVVVGLYGALAPQSAAKFLEYASADEPGYRQSVFFRMEPGVLLEGGRLGDLQLVTLAGTETLQYAGRVVPNSMSKMALDDNDLRHNRRGLLTHRRLEATGEFGITLGPNVALDDTHVIFGEVLQGREFLDEVEGVPVLQDAVDGPLGAAGSEWLRAQKRGFRALARLIGDDRVNKVYENKLLRRVDVADCRVLGANDAIPQSTAVAMWASTAHKIPAASPARSPLFAGANSDPPAAALAPGTPVRVRRPVTLYHVPKANGSPINTEGCSGVVLEEIALYKGAVVTPNYPVRVSLKVDVPGIGLQTVVCHYERDEVDVL